MYSINYTNKFKKDYHLAQKRGYKMALIQNIITLITNKKSLPLKCNAHKLSGSYNDCWECHIQPDWLLIWQINEDTNTITLTRTGTHSDLF